ncbi:hypothetical protein GUITHDRAFT_113898 [Guillardia theta CCMP2712]|uniref:C2 domain-containing protein n=1 Tax=Guillardia theta (strain CCMP2712) TaxID=905079 RepID=L1IVJ0_GUITC|nr:hypothetical protein GUITHDRAFT_113898 [Guillardia theta CCMP2712]EKX39904.1 hypothetical protein GUITHDRAFT_113898 [Guillardia theta CCMP2712]|eukprot:XP_005826884.1 hypothetical protein GUITHDRAFT_113898 [Guillardia theta CCMP2712]
MVAKRRKKRTVARELYIHIVSARYLPAMDPNGLCDCFCRIKLNDALLGKTKTIYRNRFPRWDAKFGPFRLESPFQTIVVELEDEDISRNDLIGYASVDVADVALAKGRRVRRWFGVRRIEAEYKPWERRANSEDEWIRENDGEFAVSKENNVSEVLLEVSYRGDYYNEIQDLLKRLFEGARPPPPSADEMFRKLMEEANAHEDGEAVEVLEAKDQALIRTMKKAQQGTLRPQSSERLLHTPFSAPGGWSRPVGTLDYHGERTRPSTTAAAQTLLNEERSPRALAVKLFLPGDGEQGVRRDAFARRSAQRGRNTEQAARSPTSVSSPRRYSDIREASVSPFSRALHSPLHQATPLLRSRALHPVQDTIKHCYAEVESGSVQVRWEVKTFGVGGAKMSVKRMGWRMEDGGWRMEDGREKEDEEKALVVQAPVLEQNPSSSSSSWCSIGVRARVSALGPGGLEQEQEQGSGEWLVEGSGRHGVENVESYISMLIRIASVEANEGKVPQCKKSVFRAVETCERLVGAQSQFMLNTLWRCVQLLMKIELLDDAEEYLMRMLEILQEKKRSQELAENLHLPSPLRRTGQPAQQDSNEEQISVVTRQLNDLNRLKKKSSKKPEPVKASSAKSSSKQDARLKATPCP